MLQGKLSVIVVVVVDTNEADAAAAMALSIAHYFTRHSQHDIVHVEKYHLHRTSPSSSF